MEKESVRQIALRTYKEFMSAHIDNPLIWQTWKKAFDIAEIEFNKRNDEKNNTRRQKT